MSHHLNKFSNSYMHDLHDPVTDRKYQIWVDQPSSHIDGQKKFPVIFVTDVEYAFPIIRSVQNRLKKNGKRIEDFILVGIVGTPYNGSTVRDHTEHPQNSLGDQAKDSSDDHSHYLEQQILSYVRRDIQQHILQFIAEHYPVDMQKKIYIGHAFGSLLGVSILLTDPSMFNKYILSSPSYWLDQNFITQFENDYAKIPQMLLLKL